MVFQVYLSRFSDAKHVQTNTFRKRNVEIKLLKDSLRQQLQIKVYLVKETSTERAEMTQCQTFIHFL